MGLYDNINVMENNGIKQVYASVFIEESGIQVVCSEYFNTRFNVIFQDKFPIEGLFDYKVLDFNKFSLSIKLALDKASTKIGATINKVILILPPFQFKAFEINVNVVPENGIIEKGDIAKALSDSLKSTVSNDLIIANAYIKKYTINGIESRKNPIGERCNDFFCSIDLLCCDKELAYNYIKAINVSGYDVLDITLNNYSIAKETLLLEKSVKENIILIDIGYTHTYLTHLINGTIHSSEIIHSGIYTFVADAVNSFKFKQDNIVDLIKYNDFDYQNPNDVVYAWTNEDGVNCTITFEQLFNSFKNNLDLFVNNIYSMCKPIFENSKTSFYITGEGADMVALVKSLKDVLPYEIKTYVPDEIGVRDPSLSAIFGSFNIYKEKADLNNINVSCIDLYEYNNCVDIDSKRNVNDGVSITASIKKMFKNYLSKEDK